MNDIIKPNLKPRSRGTTLTENLAEIGIIVLLISILIPVVSKAQRAARVASAQAHLTSIDGAIQAYQRDHDGLPGPLTYADIRRPSGFVLQVNTTSTEYVTTVAQTKVTMAEN